MTVKDFWIGFGLKARTNKANFPLIAASLSGCIHSLRHQASLG